ncbi:MAG: hypothetical protein NVS1B5_16050 [Gemmatimonadaceae bacterium]
MYGDATAILSRVRNHRENLRFNPVTLTRLNHIRDAHACGSQVWDNAHGGKKRRIRREECRAIRLKSGPEKPPKGQRRIEQLVSQIRSMRQIGYFLWALAAIAKPASGRGQGVGGVHAVAPPPMATRATLEKIIRRSVLRNGLEVIVIENHGVPLATVEVDVRNGSFTQSAETAGLAHMFEHMFFKANREYPDPDAFLRRAGEMGAIFNGSTREEVVNYYLTVPTDSLVAAMRLINAALRVPLFRADEIEHERQVVLGEYDRAESTPFFALTTAVGKKLWRDSWARKNALGDRAVVAHTTARQLRDIQCEYYVPNNAALIIAGDVVPERAFALAADIFGDWRRRPNPFAAHPVPPISPLISDDAVIVEQPVAAVLFVRQWIGPSVSKDPDATYAADVVSDILNQPHSQFQRRLVDSGLWQSLLVNYYTLNQGGPITVSGETTPENLHSAIAALDAEVARLTAPDYFEIASIESIKQQRVAGTAFGLERASGFAHQVGFWWSVTGLDYFLDYVDKMARRKPRDLRAYVNKYVAGRPHVTGVLLSHEAWQRTGMTVGNLSAKRR